MQSQSAFRWRPGIWSGAIARYAAALLLTGAAFLCRAELASKLSGYSCFLLFAPAAMLASWFVGPGPGIVAFAAGFMLGDYFFVAPIGSFGGYGTVEMAELISYCVTTLLGIGLIEVTQRSRHKAQEAAEEAHLQNKLLREEIAERQRVQQALETAKQQLDHYSRDLEALVAQRTAKMEQTMSALEGFCYAIAHDLRAPLRAMEGFSQALLDDYRLVLDATGIDYAQRICGAARRMDELIKELLAYEQLTTLNAQTASVDLEDLIKTVLLDLAPEVHAKPAQVVARKPLPGVRGDPARLKKVIQHLLRNALKFSLPGVPPEIEIWAEEKEDNVRLLIQDTGIGIAAEHQAKIFQPFTRLHGQEAYPGNGIGLAFVKRAIERMGGAVGVESAPGEGSTFWFELPRV